MAPATFSNRFLATDNFLPAAQAEALRQGIDRHFANPDRHQADTHQVWNYWHVPGAYTYLRTDPAKLLGREAVEAFVDHLRRWSIETLGMAGVSWPYLSLYVDGCVQGLHNDSLNGQFGYVFSLTRDDRRSSGGETILLHEGDLFRDHLAESAAGRGLLDLVEPRFNRLLVFDDRVPHGVQRVDGPMDPMEGRFVLHGHLSDQGPTIVGELPKEAVVRATAAAVKEALAEMFGQSMPALHGPMVARFSVNPEGKASLPKLLVDRVVRPDRGSTEGLGAAIARAIARQSFETASVATTVTVPILFGRRASG